MTIVSKQAAWRVPSACMAEDQLLGEISPAAGNRVEIRESDPIRAGDRYLRKPTIIGIQPDFSPQLVFYRVTIPAMFAHRRGKWSACEPDSSHQ